VLELIEELTEVDELLLYEYDVVLSVIPSNTIISVEPPVKDTILLSGLAANV